MSVLSVQTNERDLTKFANVLHQLSAGRSNAVGSFSLTASTTTTTVTAINCASGSTPILTAMTANAAAEIGNGTLYVSTVSNGSFVVTHANNGQTDRTFRYACIG